MGGSILQTNGQTLSRPMSEQVFTENVSASTPNVIQFQSLIQARPSAPGWCPTYYDYRYRKGRALGKPLGGWGWTIELSWQEVLFQNEMAHAALSNGTPLNWHLTIKRPDGENLASGKRKIETFLARLDQELKRLGIPRIAFTTYERKRGGYLHAHRLLHVPKAGMKVLRRLADGDIVHIKPVNKNTVRYLGKQRVSLEPEYDKWASFNKTWKRQPGDYIPGPRLTATKGMKALVQHMPWPKRQRTASPIRAKSFALASNPNAVSTKHIEVFTPVSVISAFGFKPERLAA